ncbi:MAG: HU family DNA-binding protein [Fusobacterium sp.]|nr:HU family DNA-binding protein [Fusobacterium sp.]
MKEMEFLKLYKEKRGLKSLAEAKKRMDIFWDSFFEALETEKEIKFKDWGAFEIKDVASRKVVSPKGGVSYTKPKKKLKFKTGLKFRDSINEN